MIPQPPRSTRSDPPVPDATLFRTKTGTLSDGRPRRTAVETFDGFEANAALRIAAALERDSGHPLAHAFADVADAPPADRSEEHTSELQSLMRISYAVFCLNKKK